MLASMLFSLNFVKFMGDFCKVFAAFKQVRGSKFFLYQIAGILFFDVYHNNLLIGISLKIPLLPFLKPK